MMDFMFDGFIILTHVRKGSMYEKVLSIMKMKGQNHSSDIFPLIIKKGGVRVLHEEKPYSLSGVDN